MKTTRNIIALSLLVAGAAVGYSSNGLETPGKDKGDNPNVRIYGYISHHTEFLEDMTVKLYCGNKVIEETLSNAIGVFRFDVSTANEFFIEISNDDFYSKRIKVSTLNMPRSRGLVTVTFEAEMISIEELPNVDDSVFDFPAALIQYNPKRREFEDVKSYTKAVKRDVAELFNLQRVQMELANK